jgi:mannitol/fructose-specific phosphotransferase system IIA component (Ntr-type)
MNPMRLSDVLSESAIVVSLRDLDKWGVIGRLTDLLVASGQAREGWREPIYTSLVEREKQSSTGMQDGFAIPHCRMDDPIQNTLVSLAVVREGMDFDAIDGRTTHLVVCLVTPRKQNREHLRVLAGIAQLFASADFRDQLLHATSPGEVLQIIRDQEDSLS